MAKREIKWTSRALSDRTNILEYWYDRTGSVVPGRSKNSINQFKKMFDEIDHLTLE